MPTLLFVVFVLQLVIHLINSVGATAINELLWVLYNKLPTPTSAGVRKSTQLKGEVIRMKREMNAVSAQDDFAKWARLRRQHDKIVADYEKSAAALQSAKSQFDSLTATVRWAATNGLRLFMQFWFARSPMFWMPSGWVPAYVEWALAFPRAPTGSVSIQFWGIACASVITLISEAVVAVYKLTTGMTAEQKTQPQAQAFSSPGKSPSSSSPVTPSKKTL